jgi:hypothetical protein
MADPVSSVAYTIEASLRAEVLSSLIGGPAPVSAATRMVLSIRRGR